MQVFMPYPDLEQSVSCLDSSRLGNQIYREAKTIISGGWPNHPAAKIWRNHRGALATYCLHGLAELRKRGKPYPRWEEFFFEIRCDEMRKEGCGHDSELSLPPIIGYEPFHAGHRAALLAKGLMDETHKLVSSGALPYAWATGGYPLSSIPKHQWTWDHTKQVADLLDGWPETWYSRFGWTEQPEPDTKKAYVWEHEA